MGYAYANICRALVFMTAALGAGQALGADRIIYDDALRNGFLDYSYDNGGTIDFANTATVHSGSNSIAFDGLAFGAVVPFYDGGRLSSSQYSTLRLWVHGGANGGQLLRIFLTDSITNTSVNAALGDFIDGGTIIANTWVQVDVPLESGTFAAQPNFNRIDIQSDTAAAQETVYLDDLSLLDGSVLFASGFETGEGAELLFVPQFSPSTIRIYRRGAGGFAFLRATPLGGGIQPNALAFTPDGKLWVVDNSSKRLLRYSRQAILTAANPAPEVTISSIGSGNGDLFDLAFAGDSAYVSQSNFGAIHRVLRYSLSSLAVSGSPAPTATYTASLNIPAGLAFDRVGRLWISNYGNNTVVRLSAAGVVEWVGSNTATGGGRNALNLPEGLAFDENDSLWVGNNGEPTITCYANWQTVFNGAGATAPIHQIDINPALFQGDTVGGLAFDSSNGLWANYQKTLTVLEYTLTATLGGNPGDVASYVSVPGQVIANGSSFPGFGGVAIWPVSDNLHR